MGNHFEELLKGIVAEPTLKLRDVPLVTPAEKRQLLIEWNDAKENYPQTQCVHEIFEAQVERSPEAIAIVCEDQQLTYRELDVRSNQLAHYLRKLRVGPETLIGICVERSLEMVIGLLGILKAGGAYVPLDLESPTGRRALMLEDSQVSVVLTQEEVLDSFPFGSAHLVCIDRDWKDIALESIDRPDGWPVSANLAYVIYTSGSTGRAKGVSVEHRQLTNYVFGIIDRLNLRELSSFATVSTISADLGNTAIFAALCTGGSLHVISKDRVTDAEGMADYFSRYAIDCLKIVPSHLKALQAVSGLAPVLPRRLLILGGEAAATEWIGNLQLLAPRCKIVNHYGPTETTIGVTTCVLERCLPRQSIPIGRPLPNTQIYVLDSNLNVVPIGVAGQLYVGGLSLTRGYLHRQDLTAERFIPNPFSSEPGTRLYKTGDLARYLPDGSIEFLGRADQQVKIRGYRIELGEVEAVLCQHPAVKETVVLAQEDLEKSKSAIARAEMGKRLIAYVVPADKQLCAPRELRRVLKQKLPEYMIPSAFVVLDALPLNPNGKIDRRALPEPEESGPEVEQNYAVFRDLLELQLKKIWERTLHTTSIGVRDNFFDRGGHSLLAVGLMAEIEKLTGKHLPLASLFQAPTIEEQAELLRQEGWMAPWQSLVVIQPSGSKPPLFCVHAHEGNVLFYRVLALRLGSDQPFYALQAQGVEGQQPPHTRIEQMAAHYITEIRTIQPEGPYLLGGYCFGGLVAFEMARQLQALGLQVSLVALFDSYAPGYQNLYPDSTSARYKASRLIEKIHSHLDTLLSLGPKEKISYVKARFKRMILKFNMAIGCESSHSRRDFVRAMRQARLNYNPQVYPGRVTLFRATRLPAGYHREPQMGWNKLAECSEIHEIPGYYGSIVFEPHVRILAEQLREQLNNLSGLK
jgi:amino acid adenylation domain-containing protein